MKTLIDDIQSASGLDRLEAERILAVLLRYLAARLPSPVMGRIRLALGDVEETADVGKLTD
jgi:hypothetical protein